MSDVEGRSLEINLDNNKIKLETCVSKFRQLLREVKAPYDELLKIIGSKKPKKELNPSHLLIMSDVADKIFQMTELHSSIFNIVAVLSGTMEIKKWLDQNEKYKLAAMTNRIVLVYFSDSLEGMESSLEKLLTLFAVDPLMVLNSIGLLPMTESTFMAIYKQNQAFDKQIKCIESAFSIGFLPIVTLTVIKDFASCDWVNDTCATTFCISISDDNSADLLKEEKNDIINTILENFSDKRSKNISLIKASKRLERYRARNPSCLICQSVPSKGLQKCSKCKMAYYCGQEHQRADWPTHQFHCKEIDFLCNGNLNQ